MTISKITRMGKTGAALVAAALIAVALTACSGPADWVEGSGDGRGGAQSPQDLYQFDELRVADPEHMPTIASRSAEKVTMRLSDELKGVVPEGNAMAVDSYELRPRVFPSGICALDVKVNYAGGGKDALKAPMEVGPNDSSAERVNASEQSRMVYRLTGNSNFADEDLLQVVDRLPSDDELAKEGFYLKSDYSEMTFVTACVRSTGEATASLVFPFTQPLDRKSSSSKEYAFAGASISVIAEKSMTIQGWLPFAEVGVTGKWAPKTES